MRLEFRHRNWNGTFMGTDGPYNRKPTIQEVKKAMKSDGEPVKTNDGLLLFVTPYVVEVRMKVGNDITVNRYNDIYSIIK